MKTLMNTMILAVLLTVSTVAAQAQVKTITFDQLPKAAQNMINKYYDAKNVSYVTEESEFMKSKEYEVRFHDGVEVEFDAKGDWKEVDGKKKPVPVALIPTSIASHVKKSFPNNEVVKISRSSRKYEVELSNGLDLEFDKQGKFLRIDD